MSVDHYENFPVASLLCPPALRPPITAIYWFARTADDLADEGQAPVAERLADLEAFRGELHRAASGQPPAPRWERVFAPLAAAIARWNLPVPLLEALLSAFEQDLVKTRYADRAEVLDYCSRSANPVGRLLLHLHGVNEVVALDESDAICSALQLINFWQDVSVDVPRGRLYIPLSDCARHGLTVEAAMSGDDSPALQRCIADMVDWSRRLMARGAPLVHRLPGRSALELRLVVQGGLRILHKIDRQHHLVASQRPSLGTFDAIPMLWNAMFMRKPAHRVRSEPA